MKVKIGDLTVNQIIKVCNDNYNVNHTGCISCPLFPESGGCMMCHEPDIIEYHHFNEKEIELPDEEAKKNETTPTSNREGTTQNKLSVGLAKAVSRAFIVDEEKWKEAQKKAEEFWASEEGQKRRQEMRDHATQFEELMKTGKTTVRIVVNKEDS